MTAGSVNSRSRSVISTYSVWGGKKLNEVEKQLCKAFHLQNLLDHHPITGNACPGSNKGSVDNTDKGQIFN